MRGQTVSCMQLDLVTSSLVNVTSYNGPTEVVSLHFVVTPGLSQHLLFQLSVAVW